MRLVFISALSIALLGATLPASATTVKHKKAATATSHVAAKRVSAHSSKRSRPAHVKFAPSHAPMDTERATQIQTALIKSGYLSGEASGTWDAQSSTAMQKLQSDNGWQTKIVPDSRALIKLGLGPQNTASNSNN